MVKHYSSSEKQVQINIHKYSNTFFIAGSILLVILLIGCGGKLGTIEKNDVQSIIVQVEKAINDALDVKADSLAFEQFEMAETELEKAKDALEEKNGVTALKSANLAYSYAKLAKYEAIQNSNNAIRNAHLLAKESEIGNLKNELKNQNSKISDLEKGLQRLQDTERNLNNTITSLNSEKREIVQKNSLNKDKLSQVNQELNSLKNRISQSETKVRNYGNEVKDLSRKLAAADSIAKSASRQKRTAYAEVESLKNQIREQAKNYTAKLAEAQKRNIAAEHSEYLKKEAEKARAYVRQLDSQKPVRTGRTSLSTQQINAGKSALKGWENEWNRSNVKAHLAYYAPNTTINRIHTVESKENTSMLNRNQLETELNEFRKHPWQKTDDKDLFQVEQNSVIGTYKYSRLVTPAQTEDDTALYQIWIREIWVHQVQNEWKIYRETWQIYDNIPKF
ncbi:hypothetical protein JT359_05970 [Candidatus Poribacteria bacterium]|nr:hypothetical protein [Candidatus Poribacteria bacterium]